MTMNQQQDHLLRRAKNCIAVGLPVLFFALAIIGGIRGYTPIPIHDMMNGTLKFFMDIQDGQIGSWWNQHNEHRIILSRVLFWLDHSFFSGSSIFLYVMNYVLLAFMALIFLIMARERGLSPLATCLVVCWVMSWTQHENLTWGFQSQFFLAQILPLMAFYALHRSVSSGSAQGAWFALSLLCGILSLGSMANGVIALPLLFIMGALAGASRRHLLALAACSIAGIFLYFTGYKSPSHHGSVISSLFNHTWDFIIYLLTYLGNPIYYLTGESEKSLHLAQTCSALMISISALIAARHFLSRSRNTLALALLFFIVYVGATAAATAGGRVIFGIHQALASRYATPALMLWAAFALITIPRQTRSLRIRHYLEIVATGILVLMINQQYKAIFSVRPAIFEREIAALSLALQIPDTPQINHVFPNTPVALDISRQAFERRLGVFSAPPYRNVHQKIGTPLESKTLKNSQTTCMGFVDIVSSMPDIPDYVKIQGWAFDRQDTGKPENLWILVNREFVVAGFVLSGAYRPDVAKAIGSGAIHSGFKGYLSTRHSDTHLTLVNPHNGCHFPVRIPAQQP